MHIITVSSSSASSNSMTPDLVRCCHLKSSPSSVVPCVSHLTCFFCKTSCWSSTMNKGLQTRPGSVYNLSSRSRMSRTMETSGWTSSLRRSFFKVSMRLVGSRWTPIQTPLTNTFVVSVDECAFSSSDSRPHSSRKSIIGPDIDPTEIVAMRAKFFTRPQAWPSGVSAGQTMPQ